MFAQELPSSPATLGTVLSVGAQRGPGSGIVDVDGALRTWAEVAETAARLAGCLRALGVVSGDRVAVLHPKSAESFEAMHAIIAAGAIAVPLDPLGAPDAVAAVLADVEPAAIIGEGATVSRLISDVVASSTIRLVLTGDLAVFDMVGDRVTRWNDALASEAYVDEATAADDPAYIIFTSGSTGRPKGIVHTHRSALAYAAEAVRHHRLDPTARLVGVAPLHFDMSTLELYAIPLAGATTVTVSEAELRFPATVVNRLVDREVTHVYAVPFLLRQIEQRGGLDTVELPALRQVAYAGEHYSAEAISGLMALLPGVEFCNVYGPAEVNAVTSHHHFDAPQTDVPLGEPWAGVELRVEPDGELLVSAPTLMAGYWGRPEATAERLVPRDAAKPPWYRTGDVVSVAPDGGLVYRGRVDNQLKVRGVRLEAEAIESVLTDGPGVAHAVVGAVDGVGGMELCCHLVLEDGHDFDRRTLQRWCRQLLPPVAIPSHFVVVDTFPTTSSGKIDRRQVRSSMRVPIKGT